MAKQYNLVFVALSLVTCNLYAGYFDAAIDNVRLNCTGISEKLSDLKRMAGINTAVTGVGTVAATGATVVGIIKSSVDKDLEIILNPVRNTSGSSANNQSSEKVIEVYDKLIEKYGTLDNAKNSLVNESKALGHWRTGMLGTGAATNIAGAVIAGNNTTDEDFETKIDNCRNAIQKLRDATMQARTEGLDISKAENIISECNEYNYIDISTINDRAKGAMISSIVGAATGVAGTVTSAIANTDKTRSDNDKAKSLNTVSNVLAGGTAVASGVATVFNATQISAIKKLVNIADKCENALK